MLEDVLELRARMLDDVRRGRRHLFQIMGRNPGGKADGDSKGAIQQAEGQSRRQQYRFIEFPVVVLGKIDGALPDLREQQFGKTGKPGLGIPVGRRSVAVARAEIPLAVDQRVAHREGLREMHQRLVGGAVAVRVVLAQHLADIARALRESST